MSRDLNGSTQYMSTAQYPRANGTIALWFEPDWSSGTGADAVLFSCDNGIDGFLMLQHYVDNFWYCGWLSGQGAIDDRIVVAAASMSVTAGSRYHLAYRWDDTTNLSAVFLDGVSKGTNSSLSTFDCSAATSYFGVHNDSVSFGGYNDARQGTAAMWSESLSDAEILALAQGIEPICIRPSVLLSEWLMMGSDSPEPDKLGVAAMTLVNSPATAAHHPIAMRRSVPSRPSVAAAVSSGIMKLAGRQFRLAGNGGGLVA